MAITEADFKARQAELHRRPAAIKQINEAFLKQAAVDANHLTNHPAWDKYLRRLEALRQQAEQELKGWQEKVSSAYTDADLRLAQRHLAIFEDRIQTLQHCMSLPKEILHHAAELGLTAHPVE